MQPVGDRFEFTPYEQALAGLPESVPQTDAERIYEVLNNKITGLIDEINERRTSPLMGERNSTKPLESKRVGLCALRNEIGSTMQPSSEENPDNFLRIWSAES